MTFLNIFVLIILVIYLSAFFFQNLRTYFAVGQSIRGRSTKLTLSLVLSTVLYLLVFAMILWSELTHSMLLVTWMVTEWIQYMGAVTIFIAMIIGLAALYEMKNSWRVGIRRDQKTKLITSGIYALSRNPYFLSYDLLFLGIFLVFPSVILLVFVLALIFTFHLMILEEERYLEKIQGRFYLDYKSKTGRYLL